MARPGNESGRYFDCPYCGEQRAFINYHRDGVGGHRFQSTYIDEKGGYWRCTDCPKRRESVWYKPDTGEICEGQPFEKKK